MDPIERLQDWCAAQPARSGDGVGLEFTGPSARPKRSASATATGRTRLARLTVWETGEAELDLADAESGSIDQQHREITSSVGFDDAVNTMMAWVLDA